MHRQPIQAVVVDGTVNPGSLGRPGSVQYITSPGDPDTVMGLLMRCPGGSGKLTVVSFTDYLDAGDDHNLGWNEDRNLPTIFGPVVSGGGWVGKLTDGMWVPEPMGRC